MKYIKITFFILVILSFALYESIEIKMVTASQLSMDYSFSTRYYIFFLTLSTGFFSIFHKNIRNGFSGILALLIAYILCISLFYGFNSVTFSGTLSHVAEIIMPLFVFYYFFQIAHIIEHRLVLIGIVIVYAFIVYAFIESYQLRVLLANTEYVRVGEVYSLFFLLPIFLMTKNKVVKIVSVIVVSIAMLFAMKRGGMVSLAIGLLLYFIVNSIYETGKVQHKNVLSMLFVMVVLYFIVTFFMEDTLNNAMERMNSIGVDEGSDRVPVYETTWRMIINSDGLSVIFGHGWNMVLKNSPLGYSAHNDFMECLYDFGMIGACFYLFFFFKLYKSMFILIRFRSEMAAPFAFSVVTFTINSMISHVLIYPFNMICFTAVWGYLLGKIKEQLILRMI